MMLRPSAANPSNGRVIFAAPMGEGGEITCPRHDLILALPLHWPGFNRIEALASTWADFQQGRRHEMPPPAPSSRFALRRVDLLQIARFAGSGGGGSCSTGNVVDQWS